MPRDFHKFLFRGNLIDLAVAVVIGTALSAVVAALVGSPHFGALSFTVHRSLFDYGDFLNALLTFVLVAAAVFYVVVLPMNLVQARGRAPQDPATKPCPECLSQIPTAAKRCAFCTSVQP